jgi:hypothetical protein
MATPPTQPPRFSPDGMGNQVKNLFDNVVTALGS